MHSAEGNQALAFGEKGVLFMPCQLETPQTQQISVPSLPPRREKTFLLPSPTPR